MPRGKQLSARECSVIDDLYRQGKSNRAIGKHLGRSEKAVRTYLKQKTAPKKRMKVGRSPKLNERDVRHVFRLAIVRDMSAKQIAGTLPSHPSKSTVLRTLRSNRFIKYAKRKLTPGLKPHHKKKRVEWAEKYAEEREFWQRVVFTDEKKFNLDGPDGFRCYWHDIRAEPKLFSKRVNGGGSVQIWGGVSWHGKTKLTFLRGKQNAIKYTETLRGNLLPYLDELREKLGGIQPILQQDNASIHAARYTKAFLDDNGIEVLPWPAKSPDLNIIENVWGLLARRVYANGRQFDKPADLIKQIEKEWEQIDLLYLQKLVKTMPKRLMMARLLKGAATSYKDGKSKMRLKF
jgi:transposase